ncbi:probable glutamate receptor [Stegodyphus dumicola]|uniref:probable glutamate receptor n=1 Tax=Stegodyphus dumicola TaxID=202533 RepID=UPI0015B367D4|nr:probable glutamate receptor [Stegodyphus dumicola]
MESNSGMPFPKFLTVATIIHLPHFYLDGNVSNYTSYSGFEAKFLKTLSEVLGFGYEVILPPDGEWGRLKEDGNWTGLVGLVQRSEADMALCWLAFTEQRLQAVDFSESYSADRIQFITHAAGSKDKNRVYLYAFQHTVWIAALFSLVLVATALSFISKKQQYFLKVPTELIGSILRQPLGLKTNILSESMIVIFWLLFAFVLSSAYTCGISSFFNYCFKEPTSEEFPRISTRGGKRNL